MVKRLTQCVRSFLLLSSLSSLILLSGCATTTAVPTVIERPPLSVPTVDVVKMEPVNWIVVTEENAKSVFEKLKQQGTEKPVLFSLTEKNFENQTINNAKVQAFVTQQQAIIASYKAYYVDKKATNAQPKAVPDDKNKPGLGGKIGDLFKSKDTVEK
jgi:hypothetical protein